MLKGGGGKNSLGVVLTRVLEVLTIMEGGTEGFHPSKGGRKKCNTVLMGGGGA